MMRNMQEAKKLSMEREKISKGKKLIWGGRGKGAGGGVKNN